MTPEQTPRPACPTCQAPLRDIEVAMVRPVAFGLGVRRGSPGRTPGLAEN